MIITAFSVALPKFRIIQSLVDRLNLVARENLTGMMVVRSFDREQHEEKRFDLANRDLTNTNLFVNRLFVIMMPVSYTHLRAHETVLDLVCRLLLEKKTPNKRTQSTVSSDSRS